MRLPSSVRVLINHKTGMLHIDPPCSQVRDPTHEHYEKATEEISNLHLHTRCDRCFKPGTIEMPKWQGLSDHESDGNHSSADAGSSSCSSSSSWIPLQEGIPDVLHLSIWTDYFCLHTQEVQKQLPASFTRDYTYSARYRSSCFIMQR